MLWILRRQRQFRDIIREMFEVSGASNLGDFLPVFKWGDYQGLEKRAMTLWIKTDTFLDGLIDERRNSHKSPSSSLEREMNTIVDVMLSLQETQPDYYTDEIIKGMILTLLAAGTDTSALTMEWAMSLLLNHPEVLKKARAVLNKYVGYDCLVEEPDLQKLQYLQCVINETLRLFPAVPLLAPYESSEGCTIGGFNIPRGTTLFVNAWAIHRDPKLWEDPESFKPERFESVEGEPYRLIPFGLGRRACPGSGLTVRWV